MESELLTAIWTAFGVIVATGIAINGGVILLFRQQIVLLRTENVAQDKKIDSLQTQNELCERRADKFEELLRETLAKLNNAQQQIILLQRTEEEKAKGGRP